jgi:hypothetical protein
MNNDRQLGHPDAPGRRSYSTVDQGRITGLFGRLHEIRRELETRYALKVLDHGPPRQPAPLRQAQS